MIKGNGRSTDQTIQARRPPDVKEIHVVWMTAGLSCDGDSVSITAAMQPSVEDVVMGAIPGLPKVHLHNPVLAYENGDDFMKYWYMAERGELDPFVLVMEGSIPNETNQERGLLGGVRHQPRNGSTHHNVRMDRPPRAQGAGRRSGRHVRDLRRHSRHERQSDRLHGTGRLPRLELEVEGRPADRQRARVVRSSRTTSWRRCSTCSTRSPAWLR